MKNNKLFLLGGVSVRACSLEWKENINGGGGWVVGRRQCISVPTRTERFYFMHFVNLSLTNNIIGPFAFFLFWVARIPT